MVSIVILKHVVEYWAYGACIVKEKKIFKFMDYTFKFIVFSVTYHLGLVH